MFEKVLAALMALVVFAEATDEESYKGIFSANENINQWVNPNAFMGIFLTIIFLMTVTCVLGLMHDINTPRMMLEKDLDWGKIERVED